MRILKITGKDEQTIKDEIAKEYGNTAIIVNSAEEKKYGLFGMFQKGSWSITIALDDNPILTDISKTEFKAPTLSEENVGADFIKKLSDTLSETKNKTDLVQLTLPPRDSKEKNSNLFYDTLKPALLEEGIEEAIIDDILSQVKENSIESVSRVLYETLNRLMPKFNYNLPKVNFFVGSTGVGKTTTIAKLTAIKVLEENKKVVLLTADTYRIAAVAQLKTYAEILGVEIETIFEPSDIPKYLQKWKDADYIFIDTAGRSHKDLTQLEELKELLATVQDKQVFLVLNMNTQYKDIQSIIPIYQNLVDKFAVIITKLDETDGMGNLINIASYTKTEIAYITTGQNVPEDIEKFETLKYVRLLLGRVKYE
ncbi:hypothetical protein AN641_06995 [Candidatus Epulonipiscioides gigas]|nr:hypothetical protein AN641_06995 [Epulopiscium sp. SCG-C07WGA-EpuloA2]